MLPIPIADAPDSRWVPDADSDFGSDAELAAGVASESTTAAPGQPTEADGASTQVRRDTQHRWVAGVCAGLACRDLGSGRAVRAAAVILSPSGLSIVAYAAAARFMRDELDQRVIDRRDNWSLAGFAALAVLAWTTFPESFDLSAVRSRYFLGSFCWLGGPSSFGPVPAVPTHPGKLPHRNRLWPPTMSCGPRPKCRPWWPLSRSTLRSHARRLRPGLVVVSREPRRWSTDPFGRSDLRGLADVAGGAGCVVAGRSGDRRHDRRRGPVGSRRRYRHDHFGPRLDHRGEGGARPHSGVSDRRVLALLAVPAIDADVQVDDLQAPWRLRATKTSAPATVQAAIGLLDIDMSLLAPTQDVSATYEVYKGDITVLLPAHMRTEVDAHVSTISSLYTYDPRLEPRPEPPAAEMIEESERSWLVESVRREVVGRSGVDTRCLGAHGIGRAACREAESKSSGHR